MIESAFRTVLTSASALASVPVYPLVLPENPTLPAVTYQTVASTQTPTFNTSGMMRTRMQVDIWANTYASAVTVRDAVISALDGYQDQNFTANLLNVTDYFEHEALQFRCMVEFYLLSTSR